MLKILSIFFLSLLLLQASEQKSVQILAKHVHQEGALVTAKEDVIVYYDNKIIHADKALYDINSSTIELFGNVVVMDGLKMTSLSSGVKLNIKEKKSHFNDIFIADLESSLWIRGDSANKKKDKLSLANAFVSSCDIACADWHMKFSSLEYNLSNKWVDLWNPIIYIGRAPVLYFPYLGFSADRSRRSGLLRPYLGVSSRDGFFFAQPIYYAPSVQWDLEVTPQIRALRGNGVFGTLRFVDTPRSYGELSAGYFKDNLDFAKEYNLQNRSHYGAQLKYSSRQLFSSSNSRDKDGLYMDIAYLKDPDYKNLQAYTTSELANSSQVQSRINYFYNTPEYYLGVYGKYFIDTSLPSNKDTIQSIPMVQLHRYQNSVLGFNKLHFSTDYRVSHLFTGAGKHIGLQEINLPLTLYVDMFSGYLNLSVSENLYYSYVGYQNFPSSLKRSYYSFFRNFHKIDIFSDLAKSFNDSFHTMQIRLTYTRPSFSSEKGYIDPTVSVLRSPSENASFSLINYLYDNIGKEVLYYRLSQQVLYEKSDNKYGDLESEVRYKFLKNYELYSNIFYSYYLKEISSANTFIKYSASSYDIMLNHFYKLIKNEVTSDFFTIYGKYKRDTGTYLFGKVSYDNLDKRVRRWESGLHLFRSCWDFKIGIKDERRPILTATGAESVNNLVLYFQINLVPLGGFEQRFEQEF